MDAGKKILLDLFTGSLRFVVPVYQRRYSWGEAQCRQLWADILRELISPGRSYGCRKVALGRMVSADASSSTASSALPL